MHFNIMIIYYKFKVYYVTLHNLTLSNNNTISSGDTQQLRTEIQSNFGDKNLYFPRFVCILPCISRGNVMIMSECEFA